LAQTPVIAIVDDDPSVRIGTERLVRSLGYTARTFASADEFLKSSQPSRTSCLITDIHMPGMNGLELQRLLNYLGHKVPIIFITAFPEDDIRQHAMTAGAIGFLAKPFEGGALVQFIEAALKQ
jgi:FixJ family two-component response regulator